MQLSPFPARIAWRYLRSKKSHSAVGAISLISICGMAVATAAIICVLSVFNGFRGMISQRLDLLSPDLLMTPSKGKVFENADSIIEYINKEKDVKLAVATLTDNALCLQNGAELPVTLKGAEIDKYRKVIAIDSIIINGKIQNKDTYNYNFGKPSEAIVSIGATSKSGSEIGTNMLLFAPRRHGRVNISNPASSFFTDSVSVGAIFRSNQAAYDDNMIIADINVARELFQYDSEASAIEIKLQPGANSENIKSSLKKQFGDRFTIKNRMEQQEINFRMLSIEKWITFMLLFFILVIASFNIISALSMLVLDKQRSMVPLRAMGVSLKTIGNIFAWQSIFVSFAGGLSGIILGIILCLLQQNFGFIRVQGDPSALIYTAYPVKLIPSDIFITLAPIILIGLFTAFITSSFARSKTRRLKLN